MRSALAGTFAAGLGLIGVAVAATPADAAPAEVSPGFTIPSGLTWEPYRAAPFTSPAGRNCDFTLSGTPVRDEEEIATLATFPDGSPRVQVVRGDLRIRYTNTETGASVDKDLNGVGVVETGTDGSFTYNFFGPAAVGIRATDPYPLGKGFYELGGYHRLYIAPENAYRVMKVDLGPEHNICTDLD